MIYSANYPNVDSISYRTMQNNLANLNREDGAPVHLLLRGPAIKLGIALSFPPTDSLLFYHDGQVDLRVSRTSRSSTAAKSVVHLQIRLAREPRDGKSLACAVSRARWMAALTAVARRPSAMGCATIAARLGTPASLSPPLSRRSLAPLWPLWALVLHARRGSDNVRTGRATTAIEKRTGLVRSILTSFGSTETVKRVQISRCIAESFLRHANRHSSALRKDLPDVPLNATWQICSETNQPQGLTLSQRKEPCVIQDVLPPDPNSLPGREDLAQERVSPMPKGPGVYIISSDDDKTESATSNNHSSMGKEDRGAEAIITRACNYTGMPDHYVSWRMWSWRSKSNVFIHWRLSSLGRR
ncbi:hypothetical protein F5Y18DRAFT_175770 [Xylariaceae sp. FL1019]|nr:hypothetical protein F5Y18DRAFT_175770 [Xylariaceae sp. FL1019]